MLKKRTVFPLLFFAIIYFGIAFKSPVSGQQTVPGDDNLIFVKIPAPSLANNLLGIPSEQKIAICTPPSYLNQGKKFPVVYFLGGFGDEPVYFTNSMYQNLKMQQSLQDLAANKTIGEMMVVIICGVNFLGGSFYTNSEVGGNWEDFIVKDVIPYIDSHYRTIADAAHRGISGHSMGGSGAINIGIKYPDIFGSIYALSPGLFDKNGLSNSQMFSEPYIAEKFLRCEKENSELPRDKAQEKLVNFCDNSRDMDLLFMIAYGMAFSPNAKKNAPYIDFPYKGKVAKSNLDKEIWKKWDYGFGAWDEKIKTFKDNILKLKAIGVDYGLQDENKWIVDGCKYFTKLFNDSKIQIKSVSFTGGHQDKLRERIEKFLLPFFSAVFDQK